MTISDVRGDLYYMIEDYGANAWTDEMIEELVDEECPQDFIEKYCKSCGTQRCDRTKEWLDGCPHYNAYRYKKQNNAMEEETKPKYEDEVNGEYYSTPKYLVRPSGYQFIDENGNVINATKIVLEKKKKEYPKTYEECCKVLNLPVRDLDILDNMLDTTEIIYNKNLDRLLNSFRKLLICRDAYWKLYGEEMGLGKPWEPEDLRYVYSFFRWDGDITMSNTCYGNNHIFEFPTEEMRDAFYENFKEEIEMCKELL